MKKFKVRPDLNSQHYFNCFVFKDQEKYNDFVKKYNEEFKDSTACFWGVEKKGKNLGDILFVDQCSIDAMMHESLHAALWHIKKSNKRMNIKKSIKTEEWLCYTQNWIFSQIFKRLSSFSIVKFKDMKSSYLSAKKEYGF